MKDNVEPRVDQRRTEPWEWAGARKFGVLQFLGAALFIVVGIACTVYGLTGATSSYSPVAWIGMGLLSTGYFGWVMFRGVRSWLR